MGKVQKSRKKSWRKHTDIKEIEEALEDKRLAERTGRDPDAPKFVIETKGTPSAKSAPKSPVKDDSNDTKKPPKEAKDIVSNLFAYKSFENRSKVGPSSVPRTGPKTIQKKNYQKKLMKLEEVAAKGRPRRILSKSVEGVYDIWKEEVKERTDMTDLEDLQLTLIGKNPKKYPTNLLQKPSLLPSVEVPQPGASYNPSLEDHQDLMSKAHAVEVKKQKDENHLNRVVRSFYVKSTERDAEKNWLHEMSQGLDSADEADSLEVDGESELAPLKNPAVNRDNRKSKAQKRREKEQKEVAEKKKKIKEAKMFEHKFLNIKGSLKEIKEANKQSEVRQKKKQDSEVSKMYGAKRMSRHKFQEGELEVNLPSELRGSLRKVKTEGNLLEDRFKSLQKRNLIETKVLIMKKQKKHTKVYTKRSHRDPL